MMFEYKKLFDTNLNKYNIIPMTSFYYQISLNFDKNI